MLTPRRIGGSWFALAATIAVVTGSWFFATDAGHRRSEPTITRYVSAHGVVGIDPALASLPPGRQLIELARSPVVDGIVLGEVVDSGRAVLVAHHEGHAFAFTDYRFAVRRFVGRRHDYQSGATITLRVPGGVVDGVHYSDHEAPTITEGPLVALVRDQGIVGGGNAANRIVVTQSGQDVFDVDAKGRVSGKGRFTGLSLSLDRFMDEFREAAIDG